MATQQQVTTKAFLPKAEYFVGREQDIQRVIDALNSKAWIVSIDGIGGIGKSALALQVAHRLKRQGIYAGIVWVSAKASWLTPAGIESKEPPRASVDDLLREIMRVAGLEEYYAEGFEQRKARVENLLTASKTPYLIIIDNLDSVSDTRIRTFLDFFSKREVGETKAIVTNRESSSTGEYVIKLEGLTDSEAIALIQHEASKDSRLQFLNATPQDILTEIARACAGLPLALKWVVARLAQSESSIVDVLNQLKDIRGDVLQYIFGTILKMLSVESRDVLFTAPAISTSVSRLVFEDVFQTPVGSKKIENAIRELRRLYLIEATPGDTDPSYGGTRLRFLPATSLCVRSIWEETPGLDSYYMTRAADYYQRFWRRFSMLSDARYLDDDYENTKFLLDWSFHRGEWSRVIDLASTLESYMQTRGLQHDRLMISHLGLRAASYEANISQVVKFKESIGKVHKKRGDYHEAEKVFRECLAFYVSDNQSRLEASIRMQLGIVLEHQAEYSLTLPPKDERKKLLIEALSHYNGANDVFRHTGDRFSEGQALHLIGRAFRHLGNFYESEEKLLASIRLKQQAGNLIGIAITEHELARLRHIQGQFDEAVSLYEKAITTLMTYGAIKDMANAKWRYGQLLIDMGQLTEAIEVIRDAVESYRQQGRWIKHELASREQSKLIELITRSEKMVRRPADDKFSASFPPQNAPDLPDSGQSSPVVGRSGHTIHVHGDGTIIGDNAQSITAEGGGIIQDSSQASGKEGLKTSTE